MRKLLLGLLVLMQIISCKKDIDKLSISENKDIQKTSKQLKKNLQKEGFKPLIILMKLPKTPF